MINADSYENRELMFVTWHNIPTSLIMPEVELVDRVLAKPDLNHYILGHGERSPSKKPLAEMDLIERALNQISFKQSNPILSY